METENEISLQEIFTILLSKAWLIILSIIIGAGAAFCTSAFLIKPNYSSRISMYVNNKNRLESDVNINDLNASQKLVSTYIEILKSDKVLHKVIEQMKLGYTEDDLRKMITASSVNGTEILEVQVTAKDPVLASNIANTLSKVAPPEIIRVVQAGDVQLIDEAKPEHQPVSPNIPLNTVIGALLGCVLSILFILVLQMLDISVKSVDDLKKHYDIPILGSIPDIIEAEKYTK